MKKVVICLLLAAVIVSAQQKQRVAVLPSVGDLDPQRLILLTDKVREIATKNLPMKNFNILKQDVITKMIGEEELYRSCKEGVCIGDLAKKTNANYGARCDVIRLDDGLVLKFELYSVNEEAIFETFTDYDVKDFHGMLAVLDARLPDVFKKMVGALERALARDKAREQQRQETEAQAAEAYKPTPEPAPDAAPNPPLPAQSQYKNFTVGQRVGTIYLNTIPGLGSILFMKDWTGAITQWVLLGGGIALLSSGIDEGYFIVTISMAYNIIRSVTYKKKMPENVNTASLENTGLNVAVLPDKDGNVKGYVAYSMEF